MFSLHKQTHETVCSPLEEVSLSDEAHCGEYRGKTPVLGTLGYERKTLEMGVSLHGSLVWQPGVGSSPGDFERGLKGALEVGHLSLWELCEGNLEGELPC